MKAGSKHLLIHFTLSVLAPEVLTKALLLTRFLTYRPLRLHKLYWRICSVQITVGIIIYFMELSYYKVVLIDVGNLFHKRSTELWVSSVCMQFYIYLLLIWGFMEAGSHLKFWWRFGCTGYFQHRDLIEQLLDHG